MPMNLDFWKLLAGLSIFLFGMLLAADPGYEDQFSSAQPLAHQAGDALSRQQGSGTAKT